MCERERDRTSVYLCVTLCYIKIDTTGTGSRVHQQSTRRKQDGRKKINKQTRDERTGRGLSDGDLQTTPRLLVVPWSLINNEERNKHIIVGSSLEGRTIRHCALCVECLFMHHCPL